ncbi:TonB-dependent receptor plug domain-containing protein, partial [Gilvibacter sp.]|uniref:TonB-dependent receptor plug domain-containing protein n=1 Tax=Gilvibacter sp. TaxID=2729997 RepID=UPI0025C10D13
MRNTLLLFSFLLMGFSLIAQSLSGTIQDATAIPLQDVVVINTTNNTHTHTDANGYFELSDLMQTDTIQFSHIGYETLSFTATDFIQKDDNIWSLEPSRLSLDQIVISPGVPLDVQMVDVDLKLNPVQSSQRLLQRVPGLFIGQHAGGGKAEQIFLRGFDIDHGTDINLSVDGLPVNMVSHAHGQGYSDLHFVIPETLSNIDFGKGPYEANRGDFTTAGYVAFNTKDRID